MPEAFVTFPELKEDYGIPWSRVHIGTLMDAGLFPPAVRLSANRIAWKASSLAEFLASRPLRGEPMPRLWARRERPAEPAPRAKAVGRPRGSRVIDGRLVLPSETGIVAT